jgi:hypothetical protein
MFSDKSTFLWAATAGLIIALLIVFNSLGGALADVESFAP